MKKGKKAMLKKAAAGCTALLLIGGMKATADAAPPAGGSWTLLPAASDEFSGNALDSSKWKNGIWYDVTTELAFSPDNVKVEDGNLVLEAKKEERNGKLFTAGAVESRFEVPGTDSYVEVRAKVLDRRANVLSAIWMQSSPLNWAMNPNPEIDIMETFDYSKLTSTLHIWKQSPAIHMQVGQNRWNTGLSDISADYHTYGLERRDGKMRFYFDGRLAWEKVSSWDSFVELSRHMVLSLEGHLGHPNEEYLPSAFLVDYVRTYYNSDFAGVPTDGVYRLVNAESGKALAIKPGSTENASQLVQTSGRGREESWMLKKNPDGTWSLRNMQTGKMADLTADRKVTENGNTVTQYDYHGGVNQKWYVVPTENGRFKIISALSGKALCVKDAAASDGAPIIQWSWENPSALNDEWYFEGA